MSAYRIRRVPFFENYYVSDSGFVVSMCGNVSIKAPNVNNETGYHTVSLWRDGKEKRIYVHRLVLLVFGGPPPTPQHEARHKNHDKSDNRLTNLVWGTSTENKADTIADGRWPTGDRHWTRRMPERVARGEKKAVAMRRAWRTQREAMMSGPRAVAAKAKARKDRLC
jgi:HNH endonuclease